MLYLPDQHAAFVHLPKTAGTFIRTVLVDFLPIKTVLKRPGHGDAESIREWQGDDVKIFTTVRYPPDWLRSYWIDRMGHAEWGGDLVLAHECKDNDFNEFVKKVVTRIPNYIEQLFDRYTGGRVNASVVMRYETLHEDFTMVLRWLGQETEDDWVASLPTINVGQHIERAVYDPFVYSLICNVTYDLIVRHGYCNYEYNHPGRFARLLGLA